MLSPTVSVQPPEGPSTPEPVTRRRGLSYLRGLSSHSSAANSDQSKSSPRHFFQRSSSYNNEAKNKLATGRRRSVSRPNEPTGLSLDRPVLTRVLSAGSSPVPSPVPFSGDISSGDDSRRPREQERVQETTDTPAATATASATTETMARTSRPATPRRVTDSVLPAASASPRTQVAVRSRPVSTSISNGSNVTPTAPPATTTARTGSEDEKEKDKDKEKPKLPMLRFFPHQDLRNNGRQSLNFSPISRTLPAENSIIRVGRYSEREGLPVANPTHPSDAPVGFKSKVVSRKHCEFSFVDGQWHIRDVASSSGTFLNHIRLSQPNQESRLFPIKDGDIVQLGIDFRGGEEMIFRCVKIRIECNRSWQKKPNTFNKTRQAQLLGLTKDQPTAGQNNGECAICLGSVLPCQALFVAPCAHVWHYKCIRPMIEGRNVSYPSFQCPNCRAWTDLEADVDVVEEEMDQWLENGDNTDEHPEVDQTNQPETTDTTDTTDTTERQENNVVEAPVTATPVNGQAAERDLNDATSAVLASTSSISSLLSRRAIQFSGTLEGSGANIPMPARPSSDELENTLSQQQTRSDSNNSDNIIAGEGPLTPRNHAGPFVFDGSAGDRDPRRRTLFVPGLFEVAENVPS